MIYIFNKIFANFEIKKADFKIKKANYDFKKPIR